MTDECTVTRKYCTVLNARERIKPVVRYDYTTDSFRDTCTEMGTSKYTIEEQFISKLISDIRNDIYVRDDTMEPKSLTLTIV